MDEAPVTGNGDSKLKNSDYIIGAGVLEITEKGYGFLRQAKNGYKPTPGDVFVGKDFVRHGGLRSGLYVEGRVAPPTKRKGGPKLEEVVSINGKAIDEYNDVVPFREQVVVDPHPQLKLEYPGGPLEMRVLDLVCPIGKGQRGLIVAPPRSGKTILLQQIANAVTVNNPECYVMILLVDERPEEVTDFKRNCLKAEVVA
ncbi:MAG: transcription termination factor Rho, partial [Planctomycetaceae bacterium]|nr:transcription termination factor Rho [Planctomycetaceae bacterium]